jgi:nucleoside phosphorylase
VKSDSLQSITKQTNLQSFSDISEVMKDARKPKRSFQYLGEAGEENAWVVILTSHAVEYEAVKEHLGSTTEETHPVGTIYTCGNFQTSNISWNIAIVLIDSGVSDASEEAERAIRFFEPTFVFFVGTAVGIKDVKPGDVVSATKAYNYDRYKVYDKGIAEEPEASKSAYRLQKRAVAESRKPDWVKNIKGIPPQKYPSVKNMPIASGDRTISSQETDIVQRIKEKYSDAVAINKEGYSFLRTANNNGSLAIVILGISDLLRNKNITKQKEKQIIAARHASAFAFEVLLKIHGEDTKTLQLDESLYLPNHSIIESIVNLSIHKYDADTYYLRAYHKSSGSIDCNVLTGEIDSLTSESLILLNNLSLTPSNRLGQLRRCIDRFFKIQGFNKLLRWLSIQNFFKEEDTVLEIHNHVDLCILWELICVDQTPLGVILQIVYQNRDFNVNKSKSPNCIGHILAHVKEETYLWQTIYQHIGFSVFQDFLSDLAQSNRQHSLVVIDAYVNEEMIAEDPTEYIELSEIVRNQSSIIFINGQLNFCPDNVDLKHQEFMELFYKYGATGVIGSLNFVGGQATTDQVMSNFFNFLEDRDVLLTVPAILRAMRKEVHEQRRNNLGDPLASSVYLATFQYIYYGNPFAILQLARADT